jgi:hypothetical protein
MKRYQWLVAWLERLTVVRWRFRVAMLVIMIAAPLTFGELLQLLWSVSRPTASIAGSAFGALCGVAGSAVWAARRRAMARKMDVP